MALSFFSVSTACLGTVSNVDRAKAARAVVGSSTLAACTGASSLSGDLRAWTSQAISAATGKQSDAIHRKVGLNGA